MSAVTSGGQAQNAIASEHQSESTYDYGYLLSVPLWNLTKENVEQLKKEHEECEQERNILWETTKEQMWHSDLDEFEEALHKFQSNLPSRWC